MYNYDHLYISLDLRSQVYVRSVCTQCGLLLHDASMDVSAALTLSCLIVGES